MGLQAWTRAAKFKKWNSWREREEGQEGRYVEQRPLRVENVPNVVGSQDKYNTVPGNATTVWKTM